MSSKRPLLTCIEISNKKKISVLFCFQKLILFLFVSVTYFRGTLPCILCIYLGHFCPCTGSFWNFPLSLVMKYNTGSYYKWEDSVGVHWHKSFAFKLSGTNIGFSAFFCIYFGVFCHLGAQLTSWIRREIKILPK